MTPSFEILTLFPSFFSTPLSVGLMARAQAAGRFAVRTHDLRDYTADRHRTVDDASAGGGPGMVMKAEPIVRAVEAVQRPGARRIYFSPQGRRLEQGMLCEYLGCEQLVLLCGQYEGVDERALELVIDEEVSIGDYILTGGEYAALVFVNAVARLIPGVVGDEASLEEESFAAGLLEYPHYTRPPEFRGLSVPELLRSGNHAEIARWRSEQALARTRRKRPELLKK